MARNALVLVALVLAAAGCAGMARSARTTDAPSASIAEVSGLAGHWQGTVSETAGSLVSGAAPIDLTISPDGTWRGTIAKVPASGQAHLYRGRLRLDGTAAAADGPARPVYLDLVGDGTRRWAETVATFGGRDGRATVALRRIES